MGEQASIRVMVVDDHPIWREGVSADLARVGHEVVATAGSVREAIDRARATAPDVVLMDMNLPDGTGVAATTAIVDASPSTRILVLSASSERDDVLDAVKAGASGYLVKSASVDELRDAVRATAAGQAVFTPGLAALVLGEFRRVSSPQAQDAAPDLPTLTARETEVLRMVAKGLSAKQIASRLGLSHRTVENHVQAAMRKLQLANRVELTRYAIEQGLT